MVAANSQQQYAGLTMVCTPSEAKTRLAQLQEFIQGSMVEGEDYGPMPGAGKDKRKVLFKSGAEKLAEIYGFSHLYEITEAVRDWDKGFFYVQVKTTLSVGGRLIAQGIGSCNSRENRYAQRWVMAKQLPPGVDPSTLKSRMQKSKFEGGRDYPVYLVDNEDSYTLVNTIEKMAAKRSYVHAVISATRSSGILTQDLEDYAPPAAAAADDAPAWEPRASETKPAGASAPASTSAPDFEPANLSPRFRAWLEADEISENEALILEMYHPQFAQVRDYRRFDDLTYQIRRAFRGSPSHRANEWYLEQCKQVVARIGPRTAPNVAKASSAPAAAVAGKAVSR